MSNWIIKLGNETKATGSGNDITYTFPPNSDSTDKVYTINYTGNNCTTSTTFTVFACNCNCNAINMSTEPHNTSSSSGNSTFGSVIKSECANQITFVSSDPTWLTGFIAGNGLIAKIEENNSTNSRNATLTVKVGTNECGTIQFIQEGKSQICDDFIVTGKQNITDERGENVVIATYATPAAGTVTASKVGTIDWIQGSMSCHDEKVYATVIENLTSSSKYGQLKLTFNGGGTTCSKENVYISQNGKTTYGPSVSVTKSATSDAEGGAANVYFYTSDGTAIAENFSLNFDTPAEGAYIADGWAYDSKTINGIEIDDYNNVRYNCSWDGPSTLQEHGQYSLTATTKVTDPYNGHEYVDLGLPSGTKWAKMNVGATSEEGYGNYYMFGGSTSTWPNAWRYIGYDNPIPLENDTARQSMGGEWKTPSSTDFEELVNNTTFNPSATINGVKGGKFTASNGKYVFFPYAGFTEGNGDGIEHDEFIACLWTSTPVDGDGAVAYEIQEDGNRSFDNNYRFWCFSVRGIIK